MNQILPVGTDSFEKIRTNNFYYVDKTSFIRVLLQTRGEVNLFTRPRRFGKTLTMSMLQAFFEIDPEPAGIHPEPTRAGQDPKGLFAGLEIMNEQDLCERYMNRYPVIFLSLKSCQGRTFVDALRRIAYQVAFECDRLAFLAESRHLDRDDQKTFAALKSQTATQQQLEISVKFLCRILQKHYGQKALLLVDEYDVPLDKAFHNGYYDDMIDFLRVFLGEAFKTNTSLEFAVVTGCLRISRESIFTGINNPKINSITNKLHHEHFGFTDNEVRKILDDYSLSFAYDDLREWYNGYRFGNTSMYCPWDIINHVAELVADPDVRPKAYWNNTSSNDLVRHFVDKADTVTRTEIEELVAGRAVTKIIREDLTYSELDEDIDHVWSVLFLTGYLTRAKEPMSLPSESVKLLIPNLEVREIFIEKIRKWFRGQLTNARTKSELQRLYHAFLQADCDTIKEILENQLRVTISYFDNYEYYYHGFLTGLLIGCGADWAIKSNRESGNGRSDLLLTTTDGSLGLIIEIKHAKEAKDIPRLTQEAMTQIETQRYQDAFLGNAIKRVQSYGITFWKKTCEVQSGDA